jgi:hypothetical protein
LNQVLDLDFSFVVDDLRAARLAVRRLHLLELPHDEVHEERFGGEDRAQARDFVAEHGILFG